MTDPIAIAARAAAQRLTAEHGPGLALEVEEALHARRSAQPPGQYLDPVSLGSLIVSVATFAWTIYSDLRKRPPAPAPEVVARTVVEVTNRGDTGLAAPAQLIDVVVTETIKAASDTG